MIRLLFILIVAGLVALGAVWVADHDAVLTLNIASYEIRTTAAVAVVLLLASFGVLWLLLRILFAILKGLTRAGGRLSGSREAGLSVPPRARRPRICSRAFCEIARVAGQGMLLRAGSGC